MRLLALLSLLPLASTVGPAALPVDSTCAEHADSYTLVRKDVVSELTSSQKNLPVCEDKLRVAQDDLTAAQEALKQAKADLIALQKAALEQRAAIAEYKAQRQVLEAHITKLEGMSCPDPTIGDQFVQGWEEVDGLVGMGTGYAIGMGTCIGVAWVFNQPDFVR